MRKLFFIIVFFVGFLLHYVEASRKSSANNVDNINSVLSTGKWHKVYVTKTGIHTLTYETLLEWGFNEPSQVAVYGYGGQMLPRMNNEPRMDDLPEVGVWHYNNTVYFYAHGPVSWSWDENKDLFTHSLHNWSDYSYYFLTEKNGDIKGIEILPAELGEANYVSTHFDELQYHEEELINILKSGRTWFGERFGSLYQYKHNYYFPFKYRDPLKSIKILSKVAGRSADNNYFEFFVNNNEQAILTIDIEAVLTMNRTDSDYAHENIAFADFIADEKDLNIKLVFNEGTAQATGYMDFITLNARSFPIMNGDELQFRDHKTIGEGKISKFKIEGAQGETIIWDVTDITSPKKINSKLTGSKLEFIDTSDNIKEYIAFNPSADFPSPKSVGHIENQNLHYIQQADYVIVVANGLELYANQLAELHELHSELSVAVAPVQQIYNEFSWGHQDPTAIRSFVRMLYKRADGDNYKAPKYLLLFGGGSYDNRSKVPGVESGIVTYQSENSIHYANSYVTDDYFGHLNDNEGGEEKYDKLNIGIGRFPVNTPQEAEIAVEKVRIYLEEQDMGEWTKRISFFADDDDYNVHMIDSDILAEKVEINHPIFDLNKLYLDNYPIIPVSTGFRSPEAEKAIDKMIEEGTLLLNFVGHGGSDALTAERVVTSASIEKWNNLYRLPVFVIATCEFTRYDDHNILSAGEKVFLNPKGGGIALLTTTRVVFSSLNFNLNSTFFNYAFNKNNEGEWPSLGDIIKNTKNNSANHSNKLNFVLLGDPAIKMLHPEFNVETRKINHKAVDEPIDTLKALSKIHISGEIVNDQGIKFENYEGEIEITVYDKKAKHTTLGNHGNDPFEYSQYSNLIFKGKATVSSGEFETEFVVPYDIRYNFGEGRISYYAYSNEYNSAVGVYDGFIVGGLNTDALADTLGPDINIYLDHPEFKADGLVGTNPILYAEVYDESGINSFGAGIGHDIIIIIDDDINNTIILNDYFNICPDNYKKGTVIYQLPTFAPGKHQLKFRVWDTYNNSASRILSFTVDNKNQADINDFNFSYNPDDFQKMISFSFKTNPPDSEVFINVSAVNSQGYIIGQQRKDAPAIEGFIEPILLSLESLGIKKSGIYYLRFKIKGYRGKETQIIKKIIVRP